MNTANSTLVSSPTALDVEQLLAEIDAVEPGFYLRVDEDSPFFAAPADVWVRPAHHFRNPDEVAQNVGSGSYLVNYSEIYDLGGRLIPLEERPDGWWTEQLEATPNTYAMFTPNAAHRLGRNYLIIGRGKYLVAAGTTLDGERAFETISVDESMRRGLLELETYMPAVLAAKPTWADEPTARSIDDLSDVDTIAVTYSRRGFLPDGFTWDAHVSIDQYVTIARQTGAVVRVDTLTPTVYVGEPRVIGDEAGMSPEQLRALADAVRRMADELETIHAAQ